MKSYFKKISIGIFFTFIFLISSNTSHGQIWSAAGDPFDNNVFCFVTDPVNNVLYAGGHFFNNGALTVNHIAKWNGTTWDSLGSGMDQDVYSLAIYNGELYAAGQFLSAGGNNCNHVAKWDGAAWQPVGTGMNGDVGYLHVYNGELYAGGAFTTADGNPASLIAKWNGTTWDSLGSGITGTSVLSIQNYNGELYVGGNFTDAGGVPVNNMARWDGTSWNDVSGGIQGFGEGVYDLAVYNNELYVTGSFQTAGGITANSIAKWNGSTWSAFASGLSGAGGYGTVFFTYNGVLYTGGNYTDANGVSANYISSYNGITWDSLTSGCDQEVDALEVYYGELFVGGAFNDAGGSGISKVAKWSSGCTAVADGQNISCLGACDGSVSVFASGIEPFVYAWTTGDSTAVVSGLCPGTYTITVTDSSGCMARDSITIVEFPLPITAVTGNSSCPAQCNGTAVVTGFGMAPFSYLWSTTPVQTTDTATSLCAGIYYIIVTDSAGCSATDSVTIVDLPSATLSFSSTLTLCQGVCDGTATVTTSSAFPPFSYSWLTNPVQTDQTADSLCPGTYQVTVTDSLGCSVDSIVTVSDTAQFSLTFSSVSPLCPASCNGIAYASSASPYGPFSYLWSTSPVQTTDTATALCAGFYSVTVTDTMGCFSTGLIIISDPVLTLSVTSTDVTCNGTGCDGTAMAFATGPAPFTYVWSTTDSTDTITNLCPGTYSVIATDSNGCSLIGSVFISQIVPPLTNLSYTAPLCYGDCNGIVNANATGNGTLIYSWTNGGTDSTITNACFGWNGVTVTDTAGCFVVDSILVLQPDTLMLTSGNTLNVTCHGDCDGYLSVNINGGTPVYSYLWSTGSTQPDLLNLCAGTYTVTVTDAHGCSNEFTNSVTEPDSLIVTLTSTNATCQGCNDGTLSTFVTGGTPPYNYFFTPIGTDTTQVTAGTYYLCVTDVNACLACDSTIVTEPNGIFELTNSGEHLHVYPNPFTSTARITIPSSVSSGNLKVYFYNLLGEEIKTISFTSKKSATTELIIDRKNVPAGLYLFKVNNKEGIIGTGRFIVE
ncbi:MAG TPA: T9SS type A sorting domain-containing protein [Bacteroidia bacterium]|nr:T9SS type A sorting domain-containing protein [Bacteroidia bacterium]